MKTAIYTVSLLLIYTIASLFLIYFSVHFAAAADFYDLPTMKDKSVNYTAHSGEKFELVNDQEMYLYSKEGVKTHTITSSVPIHQIGDMRETKEWGYVESGHETVTFTTPQVRVHDAICPKNTEIILNEGTLAEQRHYVNCIQYPQGNRTAFELAKDSLYVAWEGSYDPVYRNMTTGILFCYDLENNTEYFTGDTFDNDAHEYYVPAKVNDGVYFDHDYGWLSEQLTNEIEGKTAITWAFWANKSTSAADRSFGGTDGPGSGMDIRFDADSGGTLYWQSEHIGTWLTVESSSGQTTVNDWQFYVLLWNASYRSGTPEIWINGTNDTLSVTDSDTGAFGDDDTLTFGRDSVTPIDIMLDSIMIWDVQLNSTDIAALYNSDTGLSCAELFGEVGSGASNSQPVSEIYYPYDGDNFTDQTWINMSLYGSDNYNATLETRLFVNDTVNITNNTFTNNTYWIVNYTWGYGSYSLLWEVCDTDATPLCSNSSQINFTLYNGAPSNSQPSSEIWNTSASYTNLTYVLINSSGADNENATFTKKIYVNDSLNVTNTSYTNNTYWVVNISLSYGNWTIISESCDVDPTPLCTNSSEIWILLINGTPGGCSPNWANISQGYGYTWGGWYNNGTCQDDDTINQSRTGYRWNITLQWDNSTPVCNSTNTTFYHNNVSVAQHNGSTYCNFCSYDITYSSWGNWSNITLSCGNRTRSYWDANWSTCCGISGIPTDCIESDNQTHSYNYTDTDTLTCAAGVDDMNTGITILLPMLLGLFCVIGAASMKNEEHGVLKIFLFLFSIVTFFSSSHLAGVSGTLPSPMLDALGKTIFWTGLLFGGIVSYYMIYLFIKAVNTAAQKKREKLEY
jgi:hypothetical protein